MLDVLICSTFDNFLSRVKCKMSLSVLHLIISYPGLNVRCPYLFYI